VLLVIFSWLTPLGPILTVLSSLAAVIFLAWDTTDLIPARRLIPFKHRFRFLLKNLPFHLGFGLWFLIPFFNILFLSFAPVGATLYHIDMQNRKGQ
jgi:CysZ protein